MLKSIILITFSLIVSTALAEERLLPSGISPDKHYGVYLISEDAPEAKMAGFPSLLIRRERDRKPLGNFFCESYRPYFNLAYGDTKIAWNQDSDMLAVLSRGTKTIDVIALYYFKNDNIENLTLPDYEGAIEKRLGLTKGGRYFLPDQLDWRGRDLSIHIRGSISDACSNPHDFPDDWYECTVIMNITSTKDIQINDIIVNTSPKKG